MDTITPENHPADDAPTDWLEIVLKNVSSLRFGSVHITVHDGRVTQIESIEKTRIVSSRNEGTVKPSR